MMEAKGLTELREKARLTLEECFPIYSKYYPPEIVDNAKKFPNNPLLKDVLDAQQNKDISLFSEYIDKLLEETTRLVKDYFNMSWGEFHKKYPHIEKSKYSGGELIQAIQTIKQSLMEVEK